MLRSFHKIDENHGIHGFHDSEFRDWCDTSALRRNAGKGKWGLTFTRTVGLFGTRSFSVVANKLWKLVAWACVHSALQIH